MIVGIGILLAVMALRLDADELPSGRPAAVVFALIFTVGGAAAGVDHERHYLVHGLLMCVLFSLLSAILVLLSGAPAEAGEGDIPLLSESWNHTGGQLVAAVGGTLLGLAALIGWYRLVRALIRGRKDW